MSKHGYGPYTNGCRCEVCRTAKAAYMRAKRQAAREAAPSTGRGARYAVVGITHGISGYKDYRCRCAECRAAKTAENVRRYRKPARRAA